MDGGQIIVFCTCPNADSASALARSLVEARLAACVNRLDGVTSTYRWEGEIQEDSEVLLLIKTHRERLQAVREHVLAEHPYELPELVAVPISGGAEAYLDWIDRSLGV